MIKVGEPPYLECSSKGFKPFSAFYARLRKYNYKSIEELYQSSKVFENGITGLHWKEAKGKTPINIEQCRMFYSELWDNYIEENPQLKLVIKLNSGFSDMFGKHGSCCQALEIWRIKKNIEMSFL